MLRLFYLCSDNYLKIKYSRELKTLNYESFIINGSILFKHCAEIINKETLFL